MPSELLAHLTDGNDGNIHDNKST